MVIFILSNLKEETKNSNGHFSFFVARNTLALICFIQTSCPRFSQISPWLVRRDLNMLDIFAMPSKWTSPPFSQLFSGVAGANGCPCKDWLLPHPASHLFNCILTHQLSQPLHISFPDSLHNRLHNPPETERRRRRKRREGNNNNKLQQWRRSWI